MESLSWGEPLWLWGLLMAPVLMLWQWWRVRQVSTADYAAYADAELLPHLVSADVAQQQAKRLLPIVRWGLLWVLLMLAMAGPRWGYEDTPLYELATDVVVVVDVSASMRVDDVQPNRMARARQEVTDLIESAQGMRMGLMAFASQAHVIAPLSEDQKTLLQRATLLNTDLVRLPGSRPAVALERAGLLLQSDNPQRQTSVILLTDGDYADVDLLIAATEALIKKGIHLHVLGLGSEEGGMVRTPDGRPMLDQNRQAVRSSLNEALLRQLAELGQGHYQRTDIRDQDTQAVLQAILDQSDLQEGDTALQTRVWNERFPWLVGLAMLLVLSAMLRQRKERV